MELKYTVNFFFFLFFSDAFYRFTGKKRIETRYWIVIPKGTNHYESEIFMK